jgi:ribosomal protein S12 methylthiotransferase
MNRPFQAGINDAIVDRLKAALPGAVMRTTFIVGFPGETDAHAAHLLEFVKRHEFDHVGVFVFSPEEGTPAFSLPQQIPAEIMEMRRNAVMAAQQPISLKKNQESVGQVVDVLIEQEQPETGELIGRSARFSPRSRWTRLCDRRSATGIDRLSENYWCRCLRPLRSSVSVAGTVAIGGVANKKPDNSQK